MGPQAESGFDRLFHGRLSLNLDVEVEAFGLLGRLGRLEHLDAVAVQLDPVDAHLVAVSQNLEKKQENSIEL